jgi:hypothetical protein
MLQQDSPKKFWAHAKSLATSVRRSAGPSRCFGKTHRRNPGPIQNHWPLLWRDQWAHSGGSAGLTEEILGPYKIIGHFCEDTEEINGPIWMLWQWLWADQVLSTPLLRWAHSELLATLFGNRCGPILKYRHLCFGGPIQDY